MLVYRKRLNGPLLFERKLDPLTDVVIVVYAPRDIQRVRLIERDGNPPEIAERILNQQMDIEEKKKKADFTIDNSGTYEELAAEVNRLLLHILE